MGATCARDYVAAAANLTFRAANTNRPPPPREPKRPRFRMSWGRRPSWLENGAGARINLERLDPAAGDLRYCSAVLTRDLIDGWHFQRSWLRIGHRQVTRAHYFSDPEKAATEMAIWLRWNFRYGYQLCSDRLPPSPAGLRGSRTSALPRRADTDDLLRLCTEAIHHIHLQGRADLEGWANDLSIIRRLLDAYDGPKARRQLSQALTKGWGSEGEGNPVLARQKDTERELQMKLAEVLIRLSATFVPRSFVRHLMADIATRLQRDSDPSIGTFIPKRLQPYLNHSILSIVGDDRALFNMALRMAKDGVVTVGDLVKRSPEQVLLQSGARAHCILRLKEVLGTLQIETRAG